MKYKSYYARKNGLWNKLTKEQKSKLIMKYIDSIEIEKVKDEIVIKKININKTFISKIMNVFFIKLLYLICYYRSNTNNISIITCSSP